MAITFNGTTDVITPKTAVQPTGSILQVVSVTKTDTATSGAIANNQSAWWDYTDASLKLSITPSATSSKILVLGQVCVGSDRTNITCIFQLMRGGSAIAGGASPGSRIATHSQNSYMSNTGEILDYPIHFLDSPSSTSAVEYNVRMGHGSGSNTTFYINRSHDDTDDYSYTRTVSTLTGMEIAG